MQIVDGEIAQLVIQNDRLIGVELTDGRMIPRTAVFIRPGNVPHADGLLPGLGYDVDEAGFVAADAVVERAVDDHRLAAGASSP